MAAIHVFNGLKYNLNLLDEPLFLSTSIVGSKAHIYIIHKETDEKLIKYTFDNLQIAVTLYNLITPLNSNVAKLKSDVCAALHIKEGEKLKRPGVTSKTLVFRYVKDRIKRIFVNPPKISGNFTNLHFYTEHDGQNFNVAFDCNDLSIDTDETTDKSIIGEIMRLMIGEMRRALTYMSPTGFTPTPIVPEMIHEKYHKEVIDCCFSLLEKWKNNVATDSKVLSTHGSSVTAQMWTDHDEAAQQWIKNTWCRSSHDK